MINLIYYLVTLSMFFNLELKGNPFSTVKSSFDKSLFANDLSSLPDQGIAIPIRSSTFSYTCGCGAELVIQRGFNFKTGSPFIREWVRLPNTRFLREVKLEPEAAQDPSRVATCEDVCNGNVIYLN